MRSRAFAAAALVGLVCAALSLPIEARPDRPAELLVARRADGGLCWWGTLSPDAATPREHREHGCEVTGGELTADEESAFYVARDGEDRRGRKPRCEVILGASGELLGWVYGDPRLPPAGGRFEEREPTERECASLALRDRREQAVQRAIDLQAQADAATRLGLAAEAARLAGEAQAALAEAQR